MIRALLSESLSPELEKQYKDDGYLDIVKRKEI